MWILSHAFFAETFQPMNAAVTFQIGLKDSARAIRGKFTFAGARKSCWVIRTMYTYTLYTLHLFHGKGHGMKRRRFLLFPFALCQNGTN